MDLSRDVNLYHDFNAYALSPRVDVSRYNYDKIVEFKNTSGDVAYRFGVYDYNTHAVELSKKKAVVDQIESLSQESAKLLLDTMVSISGASDADAAQAIISAIEDESVKQLVETSSSDVVDYLNGNLTLKGILTSFISLTK